MTTTEIPRKPTKAQLKKAAKVLQAAHDQIERFGFDIQTYGWTTPEDAKKGDEVPPMCYIGNVRFAAGIDPEFGSDEQPAEGDGPELVLALAKLDEIAKRRIKRADQDLLQRAEMNHLRLRDQTGRFIEHLGFYITERAAEKYPDTDRADYPNFEIWCAAMEKIHAKRERYEKNYALKILRKALTEIYA